MRYRSDVPEVIAASVDETMVIGTVVYALILGAGLCLGGWWGRKSWVAAIGATLIVSATAYLIGR